MLSGLWQHPLKLSRFFLTDEMKRRLARLLSRRFVEQLWTDPTDALLLALLDAMSLCLILMPDYHRHIEGIDCSLSFSTDDGRVAASVSIRNGKMHVSRRSDGDATVRIAFANGKALRRYLFSKDPDLIDSLLRNEIRTEGNLNYLYMFSHMASDLERRLCLV